MLRDVFQQRHVILKDHTLLVTPVESTYGEEVMPTNPSIFSDDLMLSWRPIILIRNPILIYESWLRAEGEPCVTQTSCHFGDIH